MLPACLREAPAILVTAVPSSDAQTVPLTDAMLETVEYHGRVFQRYAIQNGAYFAPIDQVSLRPVSSRPACRAYADTRGPCLRTRPNGWG